MRSRALLFASGTVEHGMAQACAPGSCLVSEAMHSLLEAYGSLAALVVAALLLRVPVQPENRGTRVFVAAGLGAMGVLDAFHASIAIGPTSVWLRASAAFAGGLLFALVWLPDSIGRTRAARALPLVVAVSCLAFGIGSLVISEWVPVEIASGEFSPTPKLLNSIGGLGFLLAAVRLGLRYRERRNAADAMFSVQSALLAVAGFVFPATRPWSVGWWAWHVLRTVSYTIALGYLFVAYEIVTRQLDAALTLRDEFISIASHELRTPLTPLTLELQVLERAQRLGRPVEPRLLQHAIRQVGVLTSLVNDLLDVSRVASGQLQFEFGRVSLRDIVRDAVATIQLCTATHEIAFTEPRDDVVVWGDRTRLGQVVNNLIDNAIKYSPNGGRIEITLSEHDSRAIVSVADSGVGISTADQRRLFERFFRAQDVRQFGGLGLGLFLCHDIVKRHAGVIAVKSVVGEGSTFTVDLPLFLEPADAPRVSRAPQG